MKQHVKIWLSLTLGERQAVINYAVWEIKRVLRGK